MLINYKKIYLKIILFIIIMDYIIKRNGQKEQIQFDKITKRIERLIKEEELSYLNPLRTLLSL